MNLRKTAYALLHGLKIKAKVTTVLIGNDRLIVNYKQSQEHLEQGYIFTIKDLKHLFN